MVDSIMNSTINSEDQRGTDQRDYVKLMNEHRDNLIREFSKKRSTGLHGLPGLLLAPRGGDCPHGGHTCWTQWALSSYSVGTDW